MDDGYIFYTKKVYGLEYEFISYCTCEKGNQFQYDGRKSKDKNQYYIPCVATVLDVRSIMQANKG